jgi:Cft2 family RNA processing exonuclease
MQIHHTVTSGGKVLVPVFAVGRAQELLILLDEHWQRTQLEVGGALTGSGSFRFTCCRSPATVASNLGQSVGLRLTGWSSS